MLSLPLLASACVDGVLLPRCPLMLPDRCRLSMAHPLVLPKCCIFDSVELVSATRSISRAIIAAVDKTTTHLDVKGFCVRGIKVAAVDIASATELIRELATNARGAYVAGGAGASRWNRLRSRPASSRFRATARGLPADDLEYSLRRFGQF
jgi:hypothetical protein